MILDTDVVLYGEYKEYSGYRGLLGSTWSERERVWVGYTSTDFMKTAGRIGLREVIYEIWDSELVYAHQFIGPLRDGITLLKMDPAGERSFMEFLVGFLRGCEEFPDALVEIQTPW